MPCRIREWINIWNFGHCSPASIRERIGDCSKRGPWKISLKMQLYFKVNITISPEIKLAGANSTVFLIKLPCNTTFLLFFTVFAGGRNEEPVPWGKSLFPVPCSQPLNKLVLRFTAPNPECAQPELCNISSEGLEKLCKVGDYTGCFVRNKVSQESQETQENFE